MIVTLGRTRHIDHESMHVSELRAGDVVSIETPNGTISFHMHEDRWVLDLNDVPFQDIDENGELEIVMEDYEDV